MKKLMLASFIAVASLNVQASMIISGVYDGPLSGGVPKGVELYVMNDIADLSSYGLGGANNGGGSDGQEFTFPAVSVSAGQYLYVASETPGFTSFYGFAPNYTSSAMSINGDDAIELFENGSVVDLFGDIDIDVDGSGQAWEYTDGWVYRNTGVSRSPVFSPGDWSYSGVNALDNAASNAIAVKPFPLATYAADSGGGTYTGDILINEIDADTESTDVLEFVELYDGGVGNSDLSGLSLVFFNGSDDASYASVDLDGLSTNANGYFVLGNPDVVNVDYSLGNSNSIQNGADAVALIRGDASDYPNDTPVGDANIVDAVVYDTNDADDAALLILLNGGQPQVNEAGANGSTVDSNQRCDSDARNTEGYIQAPPTPGSENACPTSASLRMISEIQGTPATHLSNSSGDTDLSPLNGEIVSVEGVVVGDFQDGDADESRNLGGFFVQEESNDEDGDAESSEGIYIFEPNISVDVNVGDLVRVSGTVAQFFGETQLNNITEIQILDSDRLADVTPARIALSAITKTTLSQDSRIQPDLEAYEGMLVTFTDELQITEQFQLDRFNEVKLVAGERPVQFSQVHQPDATMFADAQRTLGARRITYDDGLNTQNAGVSLLDGFSGYSEASAKRMGDRVSDLQGILDYKWAGSSSSAATWRVRSHVDGTNTFTSSAEGDSANPRPTAPTNIEGNLKISSFNMLNFFTTLDDGSASTAVGLSPRGADDLTRFGVEPSSAEFDRQRVKIVNAVLAIDADVLGLVELENEFDAISDGSTAIEVLVNSLNAATGSDTYSYVYPGVQFVGSDAIAVGFIYKPSVVSLADNSEVALIDDGVAQQLSVFSSRDFATDPIFNGPSTNRVSMAASFTHAASGETFTVVANHFKSKGPSGLTDISSPNFDQADGAGYWNQRRLDASVAISEWIAEAPTGIVDEDVIILGDLNAYAMEPPVQYLLAAGYNNVENDDAYSFVFDGQVGTLDYLLISDSLVDKFVDATVWHVNADEADALDYNLDFGRDTRYFDGGTATRNSDHDPVLASFEFSETPITVVELIASYKTALAEGAISGVGSFDPYRIVKMLKKAAWFDRQGKISKECRILAKADLYTDGEVRPADLIQGSGLVDFNAQILDLRDELNCL